VFGLQATLSVIIPFTVVAALTPLIRKYALRWRLGDKPNGRKIHTSTIPHVGGVGMVIGLFLAIGVTTLLSNDALSLQLSTLFTRFAIPVVIIVALGLTDDMKNLRARQKLTVQIIAALLLALSGLHMLVGFAPFDRNLVVVICVSTFYLVGMSSSVNLIDGLDGLASGLSAISSIAFVVLAALFGAPHLLMVALAVAGACAGFLLYNYPPSRIFMGDTGSMFLGIMLGVLACSFTMLQPTINTFLGVSLILAIPMLDAWLAIARRLVLRRPVFQADCQHIHHIISSFGFSPRQNLGILYSMQAVMALLGVLAVRGQVVPLILGLALMTLLFATFIRVMVASEARLDLSTQFVRSSVPSLEK